MKLLDIEFDDRLFTTGQLQGRLATVVGYKKLVSDYGITHLYDLETDDETFKHGFNVLMMKEYAPKGSVAFSQLFYDAIGYNNPLATDCNLPASGQDKHDDIMGARLGVIIDTQVLRDFKSFPPIVAFCTEADLMMIPPID